MTHSASSNMADRILAHPRSQKAISDFMEMISTADKSVAMGVVRQELIAALDDEIMTEGWPAVRDRLLRLYPG